MPSPFEMGRAVGGNVSGGIRGGVEDNAIDNILQEASASGDPAQVQNMMNQIITRISPEKRPVVAQALQHRQQQLVEAQTQGEMVKIGDMIETQNPGSSLHKTLADVYRSNIPQKQKEMVIKSLSESMPYKFEQHQRLTKDSILKRFSYRIKEANDNIKNAKYDDKDKFRAIKDALVKERDKELDFASLREPEKQPFDPNNAEHMKKFEELDAKFKGDRVKINEAMSEDFTL